MSNPVAALRSAGRVASRATSRRVPFTNSLQVKQWPQQQGTYSQAAANYQEWRYMHMLARAASADVAAPTEPAPAAEAAPAEADVATIDLRIGKIIKCERHPEADTLYVEQIDCGEAEPRTIVSGLVKFVPLEEMQDRKVVIVANLKPRNMRGVKSNGMVLCASNDAHDAVEPLTPPADAPVGERVWFGEEGKTQAAAAEPNRVQKKKLWEAVQPLLKTDGAKVATFKGRAMTTSAGPVTAATLTNASIA